MHEVQLIRYDLPWLFSFGPLNIRNAAAKSSSDYRIDFWCLLAPNKFFRLMLRNTRHEPMNFRRFIGESGSDRTRIRGYVEHYELKTLLYLFKPTVHKEKKQNKIKLSNGLYNLKVKVSLMRK